MWMNRQFRRIDPLVFDFYAEQTAIERQLKILKYFHRFGGFVIGFLASLIA